MSYTHLIYFELIHSCFQMKQGIQHAAKSNFYQRNQREFCFKYLIDKKKDMCTSGKVNHVTNTTCTSSIEY